MQPSNPYLSRGFEPIRMEFGRVHLTIDGDVPEDLDGTFYRVGPNPQFAPRGIYNPLQGDGMVHAFQVRNGSVTYRNRWVRTQQWQLEHAAGRALFGTSGNPAESDASVAGMPTDGVANTNVVWHGNRLLALEEGHGPIELDPESLDTLGRWSFDGRLPRNMTAHPRIDPASGEMLFFANFPTGRASNDIAFYAANASGELATSEVFQGPYPALIHDFAITNDFVVFAICPVIVSVKRMMAGGPLIAWEPGRGTHVGVFPRNGGTQHVRWFSRTSCMVWHLMNAFDDDHGIVVDVVEQKVPMFPTAEGATPDHRDTSQYLLRWRLDWGRHPHVHVEQLSDVRCEYPRIDERRTGSSYRHGYVACNGGPGTDDVFHRGIGHFDHATREMRIYDAGAHCAVAEPVFVPKQGSVEEGDGYVLTNIYDEERNTSHLAVFCAAEVERGPIAVAHLDHRVPVGFHALWHSR